jgi:hypothetical protein
MLYGFEKRARVHSLRGLPKFPIARQNRPFVERVAACAVSVTLALQIEYQSISTHLTRALTTIPA